MDVSYKKVQELIDDGVLLPPMDGNHGEKHPKTSDYVNEGIPFILVPDLVDGKIDFDHCNFVSKEMALTLTKGFSKNGDVLFTHKGTIGKVAIVDTSDYEEIILTPQVTYYRIIDDKVLNNKYLYYYFLSNTFQEIFKAFASSGGTRAYLGIVAQKKLPIIYPNIRIQNKIASILSAYDELIQNNNKRIKTLEQMTENLYKEWFVRFRFPGFENTEFEDGIPKAWEYKMLSEITEVLQRGISPDYDDGGKYTVINQKCIRGNIMDIEEARQQTKTYKSFLNLKNADTVICSTGTGTLGRVGKVVGDYPNTTYDSHVTLARAKKGFSKQFLYGAIKNLQPWFMQMGIGSTNQQELYISLIRKTKILVPTDDLLEKYELFVKPIHDKLEMLITENANLIKQRDLLLPRLMSGKLEVGQATENKPKVTIISFDAFVSKLGMAARGKTMSEEDLRAMYEAYIDDDATE